MQQTGLLSGDFCTEVVLGLYARFPHLQVLVSPLSGVLFINGHPFYNLRALKQGDNAVSILTNAIQNIINKNKPRNKRRN